MPDIFQGKLEWLMSAIDLIKKSLDHSFVQFECVRWMLPGDMACTNDGFIPPRHNKELLRRVSVYGLAGQCDCHLRPNLIHNHADRNRCCILRTKSSFFKETIRPGPCTINH